MSQTKIEQFISIHQILIPNDRYNINLNYDINSNSDNKLKHDEFIEINYLDNVLKIRYMYESKTNSINLTICSYNIISNHIKRLLDAKNILIIKFDDNYVTDFLFVLGELIGKYFNYCSICGIELKVKGLNTISCCDNPNCICMSYQTVLDDKVINKYQSDSIVFLFLLNILISGSTHPKGELAYKPLPNISGINNINDIKNLLESEKIFLDEKNITKILDECETDLDLIEKTNYRVYSILKNAISNNYFSMSSRDNIAISKTTKKTPSSSSSSTNVSGIKFIHINYSADIENKFTQKHFLFHGSGISSWYPIVKNGLKVMSGTAMMANGAAHGNGIYFSDQFGMSYGYSGRGIINGICVVGVFEVLEDPVKYKKTTGIYVISDDKIVLLRTLVLVSPGSQIPKDISTYFLKELPTLKQTNQINVGMLKNKRLECEYKKLSDLDFVNEIIVVDQFKWIINFKQIKGITPSISIIFSNYPLNPPIIKSSNDKIKIGGLIDSNNNINIELVNPSNWKITNTLGEICTVLYKCFQESL